MKSDAIKKYAFGAILAAVFLLCFVWPIPRVIALRNILTGSMAVLLFVLCGTQVWRLNGIPKKPLLIILALTAWIVLAMTAWGDRPALSFREFIGHWALPLLCGFIGLRVASIAATYSWTPERLATLVVSGLLFGIVLHNIFMLVYGLAIGQIPVRQAPTMYLPDMFYAIKNGESILSVFNSSTLQQLSYTNNILAALLISEVVQRLLAKRPFLIFSNGFLAFSIGMVLVCSYTVGVRNGNVGLVALILFSSVFVLIKLWKSTSKKRVASLALAACLIIGAFGVFAFQSDPRWQRVVETVPLAWSPQTGSEWRKQTTDSYPTLKDGGQVDGSTYERVGFVKEGMLQIMAHPFGTGFHRNAFGYGVDEKYHMNGSKPAMHAHSGVIDFSIANGLPGIFLWFFFLWTLFAAGWRGFRASESNPATNIAPSLMLIFLVSGFATRGFVDSVFQGYEIEQFMFLVGIFYTLSSHQEEVIGNE